MARRAFERVVAYPDEPIHSAFAADRAFEFFGGKVFLVAHIFMTCGPTLQAIPRSAPSQNPAGTPRRNRLPYSPPRRL